MIVLDLGRGQHASYFHLQPGSLRVKPAHDIWRTVTRELPMRDALVDFGTADGDAN
jgi:hypothetical protein